MAGRKKAVLAVSGESCADTETSGHGVGKAQAVNLGRGGSLTRYFLRVKKGCKVLERMVLKRVLGAVGRLGKATEKRSIRLSDKQYISLFWILRN